MTDGCGTTIAAGSMVTELARKKRQPGFAYKPAECIERSGRVAQGKQILRSSGGKYVQESNQRLPHLQE